MRSDRGKKGRGKKWLMGCGVGCGVLMLAAVLILAFTWMTLLGVSNRAVETRERVEAAHRTQKEFTPPLDDAIPAARLQAFLAVRRELTPFCEPISEIGTRFQRVDERATKLEQQEEEPSDEEVIGLFSAAGSALWSMVRLGNQIAEYSVVRNEALLKNGMGLGEFTWIYVMGYYSWLGNRPEKFALDEEPHARIFFDRVLGEVRGMFQRHVADLEAALASPDVSDDARLLARLALWRDELQAMEADPKRIPFPGELPPELVASFAPFREEFQESYCPATGELDIMRTEKDGFKFDHK